ncbi:MAG: hypothetical protein HYU66_19275 [Armatimonadetes bacterium]|nr:hypothetical protein [Armatimonadota bacterium]
MTSAALLLAVLASPAYNDWFNTYFGVWHRSAKPPWEIAARLNGAGPCVRCLVEPAPGAEAAGFAFGGLRLTLGGAPGQGGFALHDAAGKLLWSDAFVDWTPYTPYVLEAVTERARTRVQMLAWDGTTLLSQSEWLAAKPDGDAFALVARGGPARFYRWERAAQPLSPLVADAPNKLRLIQSADSDWRVVGPANWTWTTRDRNVLRQAAIVERSTALNRSLGGTGGTWRCRVKVAPGAGGAGLILSGDDQVQSGFIAWLGGVHGAGGLMLYRLPLDALWSAPQDQWHFDTEYQLELTIAGGKVSCRQLAEDGATVIAASPAFDLKAEERDTTRALGFMTWLGRAEFRAFSEQTAAAAPTTLAASPLGADWTVLAGTWKPLPNGVEQTGTETATALCGRLRGSQAVWRCDATPGVGCRAVALVFQADPKLAAGFLCRLGTDVRLEGLDGRVLWRKDGVALVAGKRYRLEGHVETDRVRIRVLDEAGAPLAESSACFISDTNNDRVGVLGVRSEGGPARFEALGVE